MRISDWSSDVCSSDLDRKSESGSAEVAPRMAVLRRHLHDAVPLDQAATDAGISLRTARRWLARYRADGPAGLARPTRPERSEEHTSELQSLMRTSYAVFCLKKKKPLHSNKHQHL